MKKIILTALMAAGILFCTSCEKEHAHNQKVTYYPILELKGDQTVLLEMGTEYVEPGFTATMSGKDVSDQVVIDSDLDNTKVGAYTVVYSLTNEDGFSSSSERNILVYDGSSTVDISGEYTSTEAYRVYWPDTRTDYPGYTVNIEKVCPGMFSVDDCFGGFYSSYKGYGGSYSMNGIITVKDDEISLISSLIEGWGDGLDTLEGTVNSDGTLTLYMEYASCMEFNLVLAK